MYRRLKSHSDRSLERAQVFMNKHDLRAPQTFEGTEMSERWTRKKQLSKSAIDYILTTNALQVSSCTPERPTDRFFARSDHVPVKAVCRHAGENQVQPPTRQHVNNKGWLPASSVSLQSLHRKLAGD